MHARLMVAKFHSWPLCEGLHSVCMGWQGNASIYGARTCTLSALHHYPRSIHPPFLRCHCFHPWSHGAIPDTRRLDDKGSPVPLVDWQNGHFLGNRLLSEGGFRLEGRVLQWGEIPCHYGESAAL